MLCIACVFKTLMSINYPLIIINTRFARKRIRDASIYTSKKYRSSFYS